MKVQLIGRAGAGKDTFAKMLQSSFYEDHMVHMSIERFAAPLKRAAEVAFGHDFDNRMVKEAAVPVAPIDIKIAIELYNSIIGDEVSDGSEFPTVMSPRFFQQKLGVLTKQKLGERAFVHPLKCMDDIIITDTRFVEEIIDKEDTFVFFLYRENMEFVQDHPSEKLATDLLNEVKEFNERFSYPMVETCLPGIEAPINILYAETLDEAREVAKTVAENLMEGVYA